MSLQKCKSLKTAAAGKYFCIALVGKGSRTPPPPPKPANSTFSLQSYLQTQSERPSAFTAAARAGTKGSVLPYQPRCGKERGVAFLSKGSREEPALCSIGLQHGGQAVSWPWLWPPVERGQGSIRASDSALPFSLVGRGARGAARHPRRQGAALLCSLQAPAPRSSSGAGRLNQLCRLPWGGERQEEEEEE